MRKLFFIGWLVLLSFSQTLSANTPTEALTITVNKLLAIASNKTMDAQTKKSELSKVINSELDFEAMSRRVISKSWKGASQEQKLQFKTLFSAIVVNTYFSLLEDYSDEKVLFLKEQLKGKKYALVDTQIVSGNKKIPVRYRLIKSADTWKVYDFIPEGISLVTTYKNNYKLILRKKGMAGLLEEITKKESIKSKE